jgi:hypothetical protein
MDGPLESPRSHRVSWVAMALGPFCWFGALLTSYALQPIACVYVPWLLPGVAACFLIPLALGLLAAGRKLFATHGASDRDQFIALLGVITPTIFLIALLWSAFSTIMFAPCE